MKTKILLCIIIFVFGFFIRDIVTISEASINYDFREAIYYIINRDCVAQDDKTIECVMNGAVNLRKGNFEIEKFDKEQEVQRAEIEEERIEMKIGKGEPES